MAKLVARNSELERLLREAKSKGKKREGIPSAQMRLLLEGLPANSNDSLAEVDARLRASSGIDEKKEEARAEKKPRAPRLRRPLLEGLRRVENVIPVVAEARACPVCGSVSMLLPGSGTGSGRTNSGPLTCSPGEWASPSRTRPGSSTRHSSARVLSSAAATGSRSDFESLAGWMAGDANRRQRRKLEFLEYFSEELEAVLAGGPHRW